jgi:hypothetical protein
MCAPHRPVGGRCLQEPTVPGSQKLLRTKDVLFVSSSFGTRSRRETHTVTVITCTGKRAYGLESRGALRLACRPHHADSVPVHPPPGRAARPATSRQVAIRLDSESPRAIPCNTPTSDPLGSKPARQGRPPPGAPPVRGGPGGLRSGCPGVLALPRGVTGLGSQLRGLY